MGQIRIDRTDYRRWAVCLALLLVASVSTSYAKSSSKGSKANCAANMSELAQHPEAGAGCSPARLKAMIAMAAKEDWVGPMSTTLSFKQPGSSDDFFFFVNGSRKTGRICCESGKWSLPGYGVISISPGNMSIGSYKFQPKRSSSLAPRTRVAEMSGGLDNGG